MMFKNKLIVVLKSNGKILREYGDNIHIPFGTEYSLGFKNLENRKAVAKVEIDGVDVLDSHSLILNPNEEINLERFITNGDLNNGNKFKFIKKTKEISDYRGDKIDDGIIRIEFRFEEEITVPKITYYTINNNTHLNYDTSKYRSVDYSKNTLNDIKKRRFLEGSVPYGDNFSCFSVSSTTFKSDNNIQKDVDDGITVKGSISNQGFQFGYVESLEDKSYIIIFNLKGYDSSLVQIQKPITIKTKLQCETCGKKSRSNNKFCSKCGTSLI